MCARSAEGRACVTHLRTLFSHHQGDGYVLHSPNPLPSPHSVLGWWSDSVEPRDRIGSEETNPARDRLHVYRPVQITSLRQRVSDEPQHGWYYVPLCGRGAPYLLGRQQQAG